jgi:hypothetical protein
MENERTRVEQGTRALAALAGLKDALQQAHFAARLLEEIVPAPREDRCSDRIHGLRRHAARLAQEIEALLASCREVDLRAGQKKSAAAAAP